MWWVIFLDQCWPDQMMLLSLGWATWTSSVFWSSVCYGLQLALAALSQVIFTAFGDEVYNLNLVCISSYHRAFGGVPLTNDHDECNQHLRSACINIKKAFGMVSNLLCICNLKECNKLAKRSPYVLEQLRVCHLLINCYICGTPHHHLLINCYVCCNGDQAGSTNTFGWMPPSLGVYLGTNWIVA